MFACQYIFHVWVAAVGVVHLISELCEIPDVVYTNKYVVYAMTVLLLGSRAEQTGGLSVVYHCFYVCSPLMVDTGMPCPHQPTGFLEAVARTVVIVVLV